MCTRGRASKNQIGDPSPPTLKLNGKEEPGSLDILSLSLCSRFLEIVPSGRPQEDD